MGINSAGSNAFFVLRDLLNDRVREISLQECRKESTFRESRDSGGALTYLIGHFRRELIVDMPVIDVVTGEKLRVGDLIKQR